MTNEESRNRLESTGGRSIKVMLIWKRKGVPALDPPLIVRIMYPTCILNKTPYMYMRGSRGGGGRGPDPPLEFAKLNIADITGNEKIVIFHICALPQLYVKVGPPLEKFSGSAPDVHIYLEMIVHWIILSYCIVYCSVDLGSLLALNTYLFQRSVPNQNV